MGMTETRAAIVDEEASRRQGVVKAEKSMEIWLRHFEKANTDLLQRVATRILELLQEAKRSRDMLAENRSRADVAMEHQLENTRQEKEGLRVLAKQELDD